MKEERLSYFFIFTSSALFRLSPLQVKKVIKGLAPDNSVFLPPLLSKMYFSSPDSFAHTADFRTKVYHLSSIGNLSVCLNGGVFPHLTPLLNGGCSSLLSHYILAAPLSYPSDCSININIPFSWSHLKWCAWAESQISGRVQAPWRAKHGDGLNILETWALAGLRLNGEEKFNRVL